MTHSRSRDPYIGLAISLVETENTEDVRQLFESFRNLAREARHAGMNSRNLYIEAFESERNEECIASRRQFAGAAADHRQACDKLALMARTALRIFQWAAVDWRPDENCVGSGLNPEELRILCALFTVAEEV